LYTPFFIGANFKDESHVLSRIETRVTLTEERVLSGQGHGVFQEIFGKASKSAQVDAPGGKNRPKSGKLQRY
jgi:hypothetical protein